MLSDLEAHERQVFSQRGEDGVIEHIFECIGTTNSYFVEFGAKAADMGSNTANLRINHGWNGLVMDADPRNASELVKTEFVTAENLDTLMDRHGVPEVFDLLSIDIDGNDYWVWKGLRRHQPRVVVIEYNIFFDIHDSRTIPYRPDHIWDRESIYHGASLAALYKLGREKDYSLLYCESWNPNAFFVLNSELPQDYIDRPLEALARWRYPEVPFDLANQAWVTI
jgi:hypothetical protein